MQQQLAEKIWQELFWCRVLTGDRGTCCAERVCVQQLAGWGGVGLWHIGDGEQQPAGLQGQVQASNDKHRSWKFPASGCLEWSHLQWVHAVLSRLLVLVTGWLKLGNSIGVLLSSIQPARLAGLAHACPVE